MTIFIRQFCTAVAASLAVLTLLNPVSGHAQDGVWQKIKGFAHEQKNEAVAAGRSAISETNKQMAALKKDAKLSSEEAKAAHRQNMKELAAKKRAAQRQLASLEKAGAQSWNDARDGASNAYRDLQMAYEKAAASARK